MPALVLVPAPTELGFVGVVATVPLRCEVFVAVFVVVEEEVELVGVRVVVVFAVELGLASSLIGSVDPTAGCALDVAPDRGWS